MDGVTEAVYGKERGVDMVKWYDRIGNTIEMKVGNDWIKGVVVDGERSGDGIINMETEDKRNYWCGVGGEYIHFRKCEDSLGDLITNADKIRSMSDSELAEFLPIVSNFLCIPTDECMNTFCNRGECEKTKECALEWLKSPITD